jgi:GT2 family glycosyltransferase
MSIAIVVLTHNRLSLLRQCVDNVLARASDEAREIVIWDNGSSDGTPAYLRSLDDRRIDVVLSPTNVGLNAYGRAFRKTSADYLIQLDDDVIDAPEHWDVMLRDAIERLPEIGFLAADVVENDGDRVSFDRYHNLEYRQERRNGIDLLFGPTGGYCTITPRRVYDEVNGLPTGRRRTYYCIDTVYVNRLRKHGYEAAVLRHLRVRHQGDPPGQHGLPAKASWFERERRIDRHKDRVKRVLLALPAVRTANRRYGWFREPQT